MIRVGLNCGQASPSLRPVMSLVMAMLSGDIEKNPVTTKPSYLTDWDFNDYPNTFGDDEPISSKTTTMTATITTATTASMGMESMASPIMSELMNNGSLRELEKEGE
ncbi:hypothetical protein L1987_10466 [Smallanthus sonchifolius]|uniref:Uncharacterized protein n=1 Tax=Smallanthus sonchifolius TaxID=185202 RepID=A0ACB9JS61_9ASTR|nr:hypothetical protein L1987_10466 [Smallanthus sonchifolius]